MPDSIDRLDQQKASFDLRSMVRPIRTRKWMILAITLVSPIAVGLLVSKKPKIYQASASIIMDISVPQYMGAQFKDIVEGEASWWASHEATETEFRVLRSRSQALSVAKALCQKKFGPDNAPALRYLAPGATCSGDAAEYETAAPKIIDALRVEPVRDSRVVLLSVVLGDPEYAALLANTIAQVYIDQSLERRLQRSAGAATWLGSEYESLMRQLREAEDAVMKFKQGNHIVAVALADDQNELSNRRKKIADELSALEVKLIGVKTQREAFTSFESADPLTELNPAMADSPVAVKLKEQYMDLYGKYLEAKGKYLDKHPAVVVLETRLTQIKNDLLREVDISRKNVELQYDLLTKQTTKLRAALDDATRKSLDLEEKSSEYNRLKREFERVLKLTDQVGGRESETSLASHLKTNNVRLLDAAQVPGAAIAPDVPRAVALTFGIGLLLSIGLALLLESLDATIKTQEDLERAIPGVTFLGIIPSITTGDTGTASRARSSNGESAPTAHVSRDLFVVSHPKSSVAECCRSIRTNLLFMSPDRPPRTLLITSAGPQEGKTTVAANMAITLAQSGLKVLLVDTDMRRPRLHKAFEIASGPDGISKAIVSEADVLAFVRRTDIPNLLVLPCGATPPNPAELLHADRFKKVVSVLRSNFDYVIFDSPPVGVVTDAAILARLTDGTLLVAKAGRTSREALTRARREITGENGNVNLLGCIINDLDLNKQARYGYYYYYYSSRYGSYYSPKEERA